MIEGIDLSQNSKRIFGYIPNLRILMKIFVNQVYNNLIVSRIT